MTLTFGPVELIGNDCEDLKLLGVPSIQGQKSHEEISDQLPANVSRLSAFEIDLSGSTCQPYRLSFASVDT